MTSWVGMMRGSDNRDRGKGNKGGGAEETRKAEDFGGPIEAK